MKRLLFIARFLILTTEAYIKIFFIILIKLGDLSHVTFLQVLQISKLKNFILNFGRRAVAVLTHSPLIGLKI